jgi:DNA-binding HxlR family transcriptional regulator
MITIRYLRDSPMRFNELKRVMGSSSSKTLSRSLKHLTRESIVCRRVIDTTPVGVEYSLTNRGQELSDAIYELRKWGRKWLMSQSKPTEHAQRSLAVLTVKHDA